MLIEKSRRILLNKNLFKLKSIIVLLVLTTTPVKSDQSFIYQISTDDNYQLTGFKLDRYNGIITSLHGVISAKKIMAYNTKTTLEEQLVVTHVDIKSDVAMLFSKEVLTKNPGGLMLGDINTYESRSIYVVGFPINIDLKPARTELVLRSPKTETLSYLVDDKTRAALMKRGSPQPSIKVINVQGSLLPGHSGAPVFNKENKVIGIGSGGLKNGKVGHAWAIDINKINFKKVTPQVLKYLSSIGSVESNHLNQLFGSKEKPDSPKITSQNYNATYGSNSPIFSNINAPVTYNGGAITN